MAPPQHSNPAAKPAVAFRNKPGRGEVKVSVLTIRGPFSADIRPANPQTNMPAKSIPVHSQQPFESYVTTQAASRAVSPCTVSTPTTMLRRGSCLNKDSVSRRIGSSTPLAIGYSPGLRPLCSAVVSALQACLVITSLQPQIQKKTTDFQQLNDLVPSTSSELLHAGRSREKKP